MIIYGIPKSPRRNSPILLCLYLFPFTFSNFLVISLLVTDQIGNGFTHRKFCTCILYSRAHYSDAASAAFWKGYLGKDRRRRLSEGAGSALKGAGRTSEGHERASNWAGRTLRTGENKEKL